MKNPIPTVLMLIAMLVASTESHADGYVVSDDGTTMTKTLLATKEEGPWPCAYYFLNSNDELNSIDKDLWAKRCVDESEWAYGVGPFSNSDDQFLTSTWGSDRLPLLIRRHFQLTADDIENLSKSTITITCSYDENPKVYLNGSLIWQATGWNDNDYATATVPSRLKTRLPKEGDNVLAVSLQAGAGGGHIDLGLSITRPYTPTGINTIDNSTIYDVHDDAIYDLSGRKIADGKLSNCKLPKGIYIYNKKKHIIK